MITVSDIKRERRILRSEVNSSTVHILKQVALYLQGRKKTQSLNNADILLYIEKILSNIITDKSSYSNRELTKLINELLNLIIRTNIRVFEDSESSKSLQLQHELSSKILDIIRLLK